MITNYPGPKTNMQFRNTRPADHDSSPVGTVVNVIEDGYRTYVKLASGVWADMLKQKVPV